MAAQNGIPLTWNVENPVQLKRDLDRLSSVLAAYHATLTGQPHAAQVQARLQMLPLNTPKASFGFITPVSLAKTTDVLNIALPRPDPRNAGLIFAIRRSSTVGTIILSAAGCLANGFTDVELSSEIACTVGLFDGENYYFPPGSVWGVS